ncbi:MAG: ferritin-like domain-containing protein [Chloroflexi bacterium]|nr:ferritin-like domain-containing protein [Chloroflexota bacterium]
MKSLEDLLIHELKDLYDAEHQIVEVLPKMESAASSTKLRAAIHNHLEQTRGQITRLESAFEMINQKPKRETCQGMKGLVKEGQMALDEEMDSPVRDAALISAMQRVEHYEMAGYGTVRTYAQLLGYQDAALLMQETLDEEELTDKLLSQLAHQVNEAAKQ